MTEEERVSLREELRKEKEEDLGRERREETIAFFRSAAAVAFVCLLIAAFVLAFAWRAGVQLHHPEFCTEETAAVADKSLECKTKGQRLEFLEKRDRTWAVCRCP